jgi:RimJ/RimL family protein N-acetyltransferase
MTARDQLAPADPVPGLTLEPLDRSSPLVVELQVRIGAPYGWPCVTRTASQWRTWFTENPDRLFFQLSLECIAAGLLVYDFHPGDEVEIETFGLVPEYIGRGLGGHALTLGIRQAWALSPTTRRIWLHTSTSDHPHALRNYQRRGMRTFVSG